MFRLYSECYCPGLPNLLCFYRPCFVSTREHSHPSKTGSMIAYRTISQTCTELWRIHSRQIRHSLLLSCLWLVAGTLSGFAQTAEPSLTLSGNWQSWHWNVSYQLQLDPILLSMSGSSATTVLPDSGKSYRANEGLQGVDLYRGAKLYSRAFRIDRAVQQLAIPVRYNIAFTSLGEASGDAHAVVFLDIVDAGSEEVLARLLGHNAVSAQDGWTDSTYAAKLTIGSATSSSELAGKSISLSHLYDRTVRIRFTIVTDPVIPPSAMNICSGGLGEDSNDLE